MVTADEVAADLANMAAYLDGLWTLSASFLVFIMQAGFVMLEAGSVRAKNMSSIVVKMLGGLLAGIIIWYLFGYGLAFGQDGPFMGVSEFAFQTRDSEMVFFFFQMVFALAASAIVSGTVAERCKHIGYFVFSMIMTGAIYPIVAHWVWSATGWLSLANPKASYPVLDFAGSGVVHMTGGASALAGCIVVGQRFDFKDTRTGKPAVIPGHSVVLVVLGTFLLWFGWYGFNCGSTLGVSNGNIWVAASVATTTTLAASAAGLAAGIVHYIVHREYDLVNVLNGILAGTVAITAGCAFVAPWASIIIGAVGGVLYRLNAYLMKRLGLDDPVDAVSIHLVAGAWGVFSTGLFAQYLDTKGLFFGDATQLRNQVVCILCIFFWSFSCALAGFIFCAYTVGVRVSVADQRTGLDKKVGGSAYPEWYRLTEMALSETSLSLMFEEQHNSEQLVLFAAYLKKRHCMELIELLVAARHYRERVLDARLRQVGGSTRVDLQRNASLAAPRTSASSKGGHVQRGSADIAMQKPSLSNDAEGGRDEGGDRLLPRARQPSTLATPGILMPGQSDDQSLASSRSSDGDLSAATRDLFAFKEAKLFFDMYIAEGAPQQVNIGAHTVSIISSSLQMLKEGNMVAPHLIFDPATDEVETLLKEGPFSVFRPWFDNRQYLRERVVKEFDWHEAKELIIPRGRAVADVYAATHAPAFSIDEKYHIKWNQARLNEAKDIVRCVESH